MYKDELDTIVIFLSPKIRGYYVERGLQMTERSGSYGKNKNFEFFIKKACNVLYYLLGTALIICAYCGLVAPLISTFVIPPLFEHKNISVYTQERYRQFENGDQFDAFLSSLEFVNDGNPVGFYHVDHKLRDNPIWGKYWDAYALDVQVDIEEFYEAKDMVTHSSNYRYEGEIGDFVLYSQNQLPKSYILAFCIEARIVRCILLTDLTVPPAPDALFTMHTNLTWNISDSGND